MFVLCKANDPTLGQFIIFSSRPFTVEEMGLEKVSELSFDKENLTFEESQYNKYPIIEYLDFMLRMMNPKTRTITHVLSECNIETVDAIHLEYHRIQNKTSKLSRSQREKLLVQYNRLRLPDEEIPIAAPVDDFPVNNEESGS